MRITNAEHEAHHWRMDDVAPDFRLEDAWDLPAHGGPDDFPALVDVVTHMQPSGGPELPARALFAIRHALGAVLGWDRKGAPIPIPGDRANTSSLTARLPDDLRDSVGPKAMASFVPVFRTADEWVAEISNRTVHAALQLAWVDHGGGRFGGRMAVYVKPRGRLGAGYMGLIAPFRHHIVYPAMLRQLRRAWDARPVTPPA